MGCEDVVAAKKKVFSAVTAVKEHARERVGSPPAERVLPNTRDKAEREPKHKETLADLLEKGERE